MATAKTKNSKNEEMVTYRFPRDRENKSNEQYVAVNGVGMFIPLGTEVTIPKPYYDVMMESLVMRDLADDYIEEKENNN